MFYERWVFEEYKVLVLFRNLINNLFNQIQLASNNAKTLNHKHKETLTASRQINTQNDNAFNTSFYNQTTFSSSYDNTNDNQSYIPANYSSDNFGITHPSAKPKHQV